MREDSERVEAGAEDRRSEYDMKERRFAEPCVGEGGWEMGEVQELGDARLLGDVILDECDCGDADDVCGGDVESTGFCSVVVGEDSPLANWAGVGVTIAGSVDPLAGLVWETDRIGG